MNKQTIISIGVIVAVVIAGLVILQKTDKSGISSTKYNAVATCIAESGATFFGAFWCPHCNTQKKAFGGSSKLLPYVECSSPDGNSQTQVCIDAGIQSYPTWEFADGTRLTGEQTPEALAAKTGCEASLPQEEVESTEESTEVQTEIEVGGSSEATQN